MAGLDGAAVDKNGGDIHAANTDHRAGHIFIAATDGHHPIHELRLAGGLDRISNHLARHQRILHALGTHRNTVGDGDGAEHLRHATGSANG